jgi:chemotaxis protein methyltransferase CheR
VKKVQPHLLARLNGFVETRMGLHFPPTRLSELERGICAAAVEFGFSHAEACIEWLLTAALSHSQIQTLADHLTIGETYFFRDKKVFEILETRVLPEIINSRRGGEQNLRIWNAACSSGEEPYSVAILLARMLPDLQDWNISILATDIAPLALQKASAGVYREWSFRDTPQWVKDRYFKRVDRQFEVVPHIKRMVRFSCLNLAEDPYPAIVNATNAMDIIFCRNVLMYFSRDRADTVLENLSRCLVDGGWLVVSPVDAPGPVFPSLLRPVRFPGAMLFQKGPRPENDDRRSTMIPEQAKAVRKTVVAGTAGKTIDAARPRRPVVVPKAPEQSADETGEMAKLARQLADRGRLADALAQCEEAMKYDKLNPTLPYLQATILQEMGRADEAAAALQRALYIDQEFVIAHFALGHLLQRQGRYPEAGKHLKKALALLNAYENGDIPPEAEGMSAGRLIELINAMQDSEGQGGVNERRGD